MLSTSRTFDCSRPTNEDNHLLVKLVHLYWALGASIFCLTTTTECRSSCVAQRASPQLCLRLCYRASARLSRMLMRPPGRPLWSSAVQLRS